MISTVTNFYVYEEFELMQSTGLKDKNGKEIYEGDIVKFSDCDDDVYVTPVVWDKNYSCFGVSFSGKYPVSFDYLEEFYTELKDIEVVGNIYENKELLEGK
ncbi:YopX family protein [Streptococcus infantarius]|uniref:YopX family protein n=1 Tax=Streptococcus infantarius TaxID=102684 RepID=UPI0022E3FAB7|nr:YopX family protein [Streptococcus infantarius]